MQEYILWMFVILIVMSTLIIIHDSHIAPRRRGRAAKRASDRYRDYRRHPGTIKRAQEHESEFEAAIRTLREQGLLE